MQTAVDIPDESGGLNPEDEEIAQLLASGYTHVKAAEAMDVSTKTIQRRLQTPEFALRVGAIKRDRIAAISGGLSSLGERAVEELGNLLSSNHERVRLQTIRTILEMGRRARHDEILETLEGRMAELEWEVKRRRKD